MTDFDFSLDDMLDSLPVEAVEFEPEEQAAGGNIPWIQFIQNMTTLKGITQKPLGFAAIQTSARDAEKWDGILFNNPIFLVLDNLTSYESTSNRGKFYYRGGQSMWKYNPADGKNLTGENAGVACKSLDGKAPLQHYIGNAFTFPANHATRPGEPFVIGYTPQEVDGKVVPVPVENPEQICATCPAAQWQSKVLWENGQQKKINVPPLCQKVWQLVLWFPPQNVSRMTGKVEAPYETIEWEGGLAILQGSPNSVQMAIEGVSNGKSKSAGVGDVPLPELMSFIRANGKAEVLREKAGLNPKLYPLVSGFKKQKNSKDTVEASEEAFADEELKWAVLKVPAYPYAPNGLPELAGAEAVESVRYLHFNMTQNKRTGNPYIPLFGLSDVRVSMEDYMAYLNAKREYFNEEVPKRLLGGDNMQAVQQKLLGGAVSVPQLSTGEAGNLDVEDIEDM